MNEKCEVCGAKDGEGHLIPSLMPNQKDLSGVRTFSTGANRSAVADKPDYEGFLSPLALVRFGQYMHKHRKLPDGSLRDSDNWQKGIPIAEYLKSMWRHLVSVWLLHRQEKDFTDEQEDNLCAIIFNAQGKLHEILKARASEVKTTAKSALRFFISSCVNPKTILISRHPEDLGVYYSSEDGVYCSRVPPSALVYAGNARLREVSRAGAEVYLGYSIPELPVYESN